MNADVIGKYRFLKENKNLKRFREYDFNLEDDFLEIPLTLKYKDSKSLLPTLILFYYQNTPDKILDKWMGVPVTFKEVSGNIDKWKTRKEKEIKKEGNFNVIKQENQEFNFGFVNLDYETKILETFKKLNKFNPYHWAKISEEEDKKFFVIFYNELFPQDFQREDFSKISSKFVGKETGEILKLGKVKTDSIFYDCSDFFDLVKYPNKTTDSRKGEEGEITIYRPKKLLFRKQTFQDGTSSFPCSIVDNEIIVINPGKFYKPGDVYGVSSQQGVSHIYKKSGSKEKMAIVEISEVVREKWNSGIKIDNSSRLKKFRKYKNHVSLNSGFYHYIGNDENLDVTVFKYGQFKPTTNKKYKFVKDEIFESINFSTLSGVCMQKNSIYTGSKTGLIPFSGVCRNINSETDIIYIEDNKYNINSTFKKIDIPEEKKKESYIYKRIRKLEGRVKRNYEKTIILEEDDINNNLRKILNSEKDFKEEEYESDSYEDTSEDQRKAINENIPQGWSWHAYGVRMPERDVNFLPFEDVIKLDWTSGRLDSSGNPTKKYENVNSDGTTDVYVASDTKIYTVYKKIN